MNPQDEATKYGATFTQPQAISDFHSLGSKYGATYTPPQQQPTQPQNQPSENPGGIGNIGNDINTAGSNVSDAISGQGQYAGQNPIQRGFGAVSEASSAPLNVAADIIPGGKEALSAVGGAFSGVVNWLGDKIGSTQMAQDFVTKHPDAANTLQTMAGIGQSAGNIAGNILGAKGGTEGIKKVAEVAPKVASEVVGATKNVAGAVREGLAPTLSPEEATGQVIQGKTEDVPAAQRTLSTIDTAGVKTYKDLQTKLNAEIKPLALQVDAELSKNNTGKSIKSYQQIVGEGKAGVRVNYVQQAIQDLKDFYSKTKDASGLSKIKAFENKGKISGLNLKNVNDLARLHGREISAFNANGEAASGLSKQAAENTRMGLKGIARQGLGGKEAQALDARLTDLYDTKALIDKQVEKVNTASQKTPKQGIIPKAVGKTIRVANTITGRPLDAIGHAMGNVGTPGGLSPVEIEANLVKNLKTIRGKVQ